MAEKCAKRSRYALSSSQKKQLRPVQNANMSSSTKLDCFLFESSVSTTVRPSHWPHHSEKSLTAQTNKKEAVARAHNEFWPFFGAILREFGSHNNVSLRSRTRWPTYSELPVDLHIRERDIDICSKLFSKQGILAIFQLHDFFFSARHSLFGLQRSSSSGSLHQITYFLPHLPCILSSFTYFHTYLLTFFTFILLLSCTKSAYGSYVLLAVPVGVLAYL